MFTARKGIVSMVCQILAPLRQGAVRHSQVTGDLGLRFLAGLKQVYCFHLKFFRVRFLLFLHDTCSPLWSLLFRVYSLHKGGPWSVFHYESTCTRTRLDGNRQKKCHCRIRHVLCSESDSWRFA